MLPDNKALEEKRRWLEQVARNAVVGLGENEAEKLISAFTRLSPPESESPKIHLITISSSFKPGAISRKPGNILLNWRKLIDFVPDTALAGIGAATATAAAQPWVIPLAAFYVWNKVWRGAEEKLTDVEACILLALWRNRNSENKVKEDDGFMHTNALRSSVQQPAISLGDYTNALTRLARLECVEIEDGVVWLREWIRVKY